eukprot:TRINITY_DN2160_c0_g1_i2.p1 TRINITY_DN2160_c0_g1~~TRINITY_DN2160_c0_g1_i2.p1  ORF type:complete len:638 (+),score=188.55 TRINITY_DN2160_c0_g1_i2:58-1971(+)
MSGDGNRALRPWNSAKAPPDNRRSLFDLSDDEDDKAMITKQPGKRQQSCSPVLRQKPAKKKLTSFFRGIDDKDADDTKTYERSKQKKFVLKNKCVGSGNSPDEAEAGERNTEKDGNSAEQRSGYFQDNGDLNASRERVAQKIRDMNKATKENSPTERKLTAVRTEHQENSPYERKPTGRTEYQENSPYRRKPTSRMEHAQNSPFDRKPAGGRTEHQESSPYGRKPTSRTSNVEQKENRKQDDLNRFCKFTDRKQAGSSPEDKKTAIVQALDQLDKEDDISKDKKDLDTSFNNNSDDVNVELGEPEKDSVTAISPPATPQDKTPRVVKEVQISPEVMEVCYMHALSIETQEVMGLLIGSIKDDVVIIRSLMVGKRTTKEKSRVEIDDIELIAASELATSLKDEKDQVLQVVGWYHSHPHITVLPSRVDLRTQSGGQLMDKHFVGLIFSVFNKNKETLEEKTQIIAFQSGPQKEDGSFKLIQIPVKIEDTASMVNEAVFVSVYSAMADTWLKPAEEEYEEYQKHVNPAIDDKVAEMHNSALLTTRLTTIYRDIAEPAMRNLETKIRKLEVSLSSSSQSTPSNNSPGSSCVTSPAQGTSSTNQSSLISGHQTKPGGSSVKEEKPDQNEPRTSNFTESEEF